MGYFLMGVLILIALNILVLSAWLRKCQVIDKRTDWFITSAVFVAAYFIGLYADKILGL